MNVKKANIKDRMYLLSEPSGTWSYLEIMKYMNCSYGTARKIIKAVEEKKGVLSWYENKSRRRVKINNVLEEFGTSREDELDILKKTIEIRKEIK